MAMSFCMKGLFSSSPRLWQNSFQSQWEQGCPANISVTNRASLKLIFWHWRISFITMHHCKLYQGESSSLPSSLSVSSSNIAAHRHTRDMAGKQWEMLFHWQSVARQECYLFLLASHEILLIWMCRQRVGTIHCKTKKPTAGIARLFEEFAFSVPV